MGDEAGTSPISPARFWMRASEDKRATSDSSSPISPSIRVCRAWTSWTSKPRLVVVLFWSTGSIALTVAPTAPADTAVAVYLPDRLLFDFNSIEVGPADLPQLDLAARLLAAFPQLTIRVVARTDATGSDDLNLQVANLRATAVCNYLLSIGASPSQIVLDPVGEADEPHDEPDDEDAATDRHVELVIEGALRG